jgi:hypothetical protein
LGETLFPYGRLHKKVAEPSDPGPESCYFPGTRATFQNTCALLHSPRSELQRGIGDRINYNNRNTIDWLGASVQAEKASQKGSIYGMAGWARNSHTFEDFFTDDGAGNPLVLQSGWISGGQMKGGASRNVTDPVSLFANAGFVSQVPVFDDVYNVLDKLYVSDALDNSSYNGFDDDHDADDAELFLGLPRTFNLGFEVKF